MIPDTPPNNGVFIVDTAELFSALEGHSGERRGLERMCRLLGMRNLEYMHNAGNDAHVSPRFVCFRSAIVQIYVIDGNAPRSSLQWTLEALRSMASGQPLDMQREERWPSQTETNAFGASGVKVLRQPWEVDSDLDDMEGMFGDYQGEPEPGLISDDEVLPV